MVKGKKSKRSANSGAVVTGGTTAGVNSAVVHKRGKSHKNVELDYNDYDDNAEDGNGDEENGETKEVEKQDDTELGVVSYYINLIDKHINTRHVLQLFLLLFLINLLYLIFKIREDNKENKENVMNNLIIGSCIILSFVLEMFAVLNSRFKNYQKKLIERKKQVQREGEGEGEGEEGMTEIKAPELIEFNYIYNILIPLMIILIKKEDSTTIISSCIVQLSYMNMIVRIMISYVILFQFNEGEMDILKMIVPIVNCFFYELINKFIGNNLPIYEKTTLGLLMTSLIYFINPIDEIDLTLVLMKNLFISLIISLLLVYPIYEIFKNVKERTMRFILLISIYLSFIIIYLIISDKLLLNIINKFPINWLIEFIKDDEYRLKIFKRWIILSLVLIPSIFILFNKMNDKSNKYLNFKRKIWHYLIFILIILNNEDFQMISISLIGLLGILIMIEILRSNKIKPIGDKLNKLFIKFEDDKDLKNEIIVSYIYLILGIGLPIWMNNVNKFKESSYIGIILLGLGDSNASIIGSKFGKTKWPDSKKSIEGSIGMFLGTIIGFKILDMRVELTESLNWSNRIILGLIVSIFEGLTDMNDNLYVPLIGYICSLELQCFNE